MSRAVNENEKGYISMLPTDHKKALQENLSEAVQDYLKQGGKIEQVGSEANRNPVFITDNVIKAKKGRLRRTW